MRLRGLCSLILLSTFLASAKQVPNILLIMVDDTGREFYNDYGSKQNLTPQISKFAEQAVTFTNCESTPICTPSRVKIMGNVPSSVVINF